MRRAVFFDRDGTVTEEVGYLTDLSRMQLIPGAGAAIKALNDAGISVVLVTNQAGVARGLFPESLIHEAHELLFRMLAKDGARIDGVYYCPHHPTAGSTAYTQVCHCRKPATGLLEQASREMDIDVRRSFVVGDKWSDIELGQRAGAGTVLVTTGYGGDEPGAKRPAQVRDPDYTARDISDAVAWLLGRMKGEGA